MTRYTSLESPLPQTARNGWPQRLPLALLGETNRRGKHPCPPHQNTSHVTGKPPILYFATPVVLISSINEDGSANLAPMSSAFWLSWRCILGLATASKTTENLKLTGEAVLNLSSSAQADHVDRIALTTGSDPVPKGKQVRGHRTERHKSKTAGFHRIASETVAPPRAAECPVQMDAVVEH